MSELRLRVWNTAAKEPMEVPLPATQPEAPCTVRLRSLLGSSGIHLVVSDEAAVRLRAEIAAGPGEVVPLQIGVDEEGAPHVWGRGLDVLLLPVDAFYDPPPPIQPPKQGPIDLAIVI